MVRARKVLSKRREKIIRREKLLSQFGLETKIGCASIGIPHHVAAVVAFAKEDDFYREIVSVARRNESGEQKREVLGRDNSEKK